MQPLPSPPSLPSPLSLLSLLFLFSLPAFAQSTDSVTITGRIRNLTVRMYRQNSEIVFSRNNILQASRELNRPALLQPDGSFRVTLPLTYPLEEIYFNYGQVSTPFLASAGAIDIQLDADSLFVAEAPFRFSGVNALENSELTRFQAFSFKNRRTDNQRLSERVADASPEQTFRTVLSEYEQPAARFAQGRELPVLLINYLQRVNRYNAAAFTFDKAVAEQQTVSASLIASLLPPTDSLLTAARAVAWQRYAVYQNAHLGNEAIQNSLSPNRSVSVPVMARLLEQYSKNLTTEEATRLRELQTARTARNSDMTLMSELFRRNSDTLALLINYENAREKIWSRMDSAGREFMKAYAVSSSMPTIRFWEQRLLVDYVRPQLRDLRYRRSLDELYALEAKDSLLIQQVNARMEKGIPDKPVEALPGMFLLNAQSLSGSQVLDQIRAMGRGRLIYVTVWEAPADPLHTLALQQKAWSQTFSERDLLPVYVTISEDESQIWQEWLARTRPRGLHVFTTPDQVGGLLVSMRAYELPAATLLGRDGKFIQRRAPLPDKPAELDKLLGR